MTGACEAGAGAAGPAAEAVAEAADAPDAAEATDALAAAGDAVASAAEVVALAAATGVAAGAAVAAGVADSADATEAADAWDLGLRLGLGVAEAPAGDAVEDAEAAAAEDAEAAASVSDAVGDIAAAVATPDVAGALAVLVAASVGEGGGELLGEDFFFLGAMRSAPKRHLIARIIVPHGDSEQQVRSQQKVHFLRGACAVRMPTLAHPGGQPNLRPPSKCKCRCGTDCPPASLQLITKR